MDNALQTVPVSQKIQSVKALLESRKDEFAKALPKHLPVEKLLRVALTAVQRTPKLLDCSPASLYGAIMQAASLGLEPDGLMGQAYLVPYKNTCTLIVGYRGLISLARRSGEVSTVAAHVVHEKDQFSFQQGTEPFLHHVPWLSDDPGPVVGAYCVARMKDGTYQFEVQSVADLEKIRSRSKATNDGPWVTDTEEMYRKCPVRKLCKFLPASPELQSAVTLDETGELGLPQGLESLAEGIIPAERIRRASQVAAADFIPETIQPEPETIQPNPDPFAAPVETNGAEPDPFADSDFQAPEAEEAQQPAPVEQEPAPAPKPKAAPKPKPVPAPAPAAAPAPQKPEPVPAPQPKPVQPNLPPPSKAPVDPKAVISKEQFTELLATAKTNNWTPEEIRDLLKRRGVSQLRDLTQEHYPVFMLTVSQRRG